MQLEIAPWALPRESIPFRVTWVEPFDYDRIELSVSKDMKISELLNVGKHTIDESNATIYEVKKVPNSPSYFGGAVQSKRIPRKLKTTRIIDVRFVLHSKLVRTETLEANIFRPWIQVTNAPKSIELDPSRIQEIPISMHYVGFGDISIRIRGRMRGELVTRNKSIAYELTKGILEYEREIEASKRGRLTERTHVSPQSVSIRTRKMLELLENPPSEAELLETIEDLRDDLSNQKLRKSMSDALNSRIEELLLGMALDMKSRHPSGNVSLANAQTSVDAALATQTEELQVTVRYSDKLGNMYRPLRIPIKIIAKRKKGLIAVATIPIKLEKWKSEPFMNVSGFGNGN